MHKIQELHAFFIGYNFCVRLFFLFNSRATIAAARWPQEHKMNYKLILAIETARSHAHIRYDWLNYLFGNISHGANLLKERVYNSFPFSNQNLKFLSVAEQYFLILNFKKVNLNQWKDLNTSILPFNYFYLLIWCVWKINYIQFVQIFTIRTCILQFSFKLKEPYYTMLERQVTRKKKDKNKFAIKRTKKWYSLEWRSISEDFWSASAAVWRSFLYSVVSADVRGLPTT